MKRYGGERQKFGIRASRNMGSSLCFLSIVVPGHNEFILIWFQIVVVLFFWINYILNLCRVGIYGTIITKQGFELSLVLNLGFALSATVTFLYLVLYSQSAKTLWLLEIIHYSGIILLIAYLTLIIIYYEFQGTELETPFLLLLMVAVAASILLLVFVDLKISQYVSFAVLGVAVTIILAVHWATIASYRFVKLFYQPLIMESLILLFAVVLFIFRIPELCCPNTRWVHLYFNSQIILFIFVLNFLYELHGVYIRTIKLEEGSFSQREQDQYLQSEF